MSIMQVNSENLNTDAQMLQKASNVLESYGRCVTSEKKRLNKGSGLFLGNYKKRLGAAGDTLRDLSDDLEQLSKVLYAVGDISYQTDLKVHHQLNGTMNEYTGQRLINEAIAPVIDAITEGVDKVVDMLGRFIQSTPDGQESEQHKQEATVIQEEPAKVVILNDSGQWDKDGTRVEEIPVVYTEDYIPSHSVDEQNVVTFNIPGKGEVSLNEFPVGSKYPNSYTVTINGKPTYLAGAQCLGFARYFHEKVYGDHHIIDETDSFTRTYHEIRPGTLTEETFKELITQGGFGTHIRTYPSSSGSYGHSMIVVDVTDEGLTIMDANGDGAGTVALKTYTWAKYMETWGGRGIEYIETYDE